ATVEPFALHVRVAFGSWGRAEGSGVAIQVPAHFAAVGLRAGLRPEFVVLAGQHPGEKSRDQAQGREVMPSDVHRRPHGSVARARFRYGITSAPAKSCVWSSVGRSSPSMSTAGSPSCHTAAVSICMGCMSDRWKSPVA